MAMRYDEKRDGPALRECERLGFNPIPWPLGDGHHTDVPFSELDQLTGKALAGFLGTLFADVEGENSRYWYHERTSVDEWSRVARALRLHGLRVCNASGDEAVGTWERA